MKLLLLKKTINFLYHFFSFLFPTNKNKVTLCTNRSDSLSGNLKNIYQVMQSDEELQIKIVCFNYHRSLRGKINYFWYSIIALFHLSTSSVFIIDDYFFPIYCIHNKKKQNQIIQVWHAIGHLKKYGLSIQKNTESIINHHSNYDWVLANAESDRFALVDSFAISPDKVIITGAPRLDDLTKLGSPSISDTKIKLLYAPTYRTAKNDDPAYEYINNFLAEFSEQFTDESIKLYVSLHPYFKLDKIIKVNNSKIEIFQDTSRSSSLLSKVDCLITDYSSLLLDYSFFEKSIKIYAPDYEEYTKSVGFFVDYQEYLGLPIYKTATDLINCLFEFPIKEKECIQRLKQENFPFLDSKNSERAYLFVKKIMTEKSK